MPRDGTNELIVSEEIVNNKGLHIGDGIGSDVDANDGLKGSYEIVGIIKGNAVLSIGDLEYAVSMNRVLSTGIMGKTSALSNMFSSSDVEYSVYSYENEEADIIEFGKMLRISMFVITIFVFLVIVFMVLFMTYMYMAQRKSEYGILIALGYKKKDILINNRKEYLFLCSIGILLK